MLRVFEQNKLETVVQKNKFRLRYVILLQIYDINYYNSVNSYMERYAKDNFDNLSQIRDRDCNNDSIIFRGLITPSRSALMDLSNQQYPKQQNILYSNKKDNLKLKDHLIYLQTQLSEKLNQISNKDQRILVLKQQIQQKQINKETNQKLQNLKTIQSQNQFLSKNNKNLFKSTARLTQQNSKLSEKVQIQSKQLKITEQKLKCYQVTINNLRINQKLFIAEKKSLISQSQKDMLQLQNIKNKFDAQKSQLLQYINHLQITSRTSSYGSQLFTHQDIVFKANSIELQQFQSKTKNNKRNLYGINLQGVSEKYVQRKTGQNKIGRRKLSCV